MRGRSATELTDRLVLANAADLLTARPLIEQAAAGVVGGAAFRQLFRAAVLDVHRATFDRDLDTVTLTIADAGTVVAAARGGAAPSRSRPDPRRRADHAGARRESTPAAADLVRIAERVRLLAADPRVAARAGAGARDRCSRRDRRRAVGRLGAGAAGVGMLIVVGYARRALGGRREVDGADDRDAAAGIWDAYVADLRTAGWILAGSGAVVAAAAASLLPPVGIEPALRRRRAAGRPTEPAHPGAAASARRGADRGRRRGRRPRRRRW